MDIKHLNSGDRKERSSDTLDYLLINSLHTKIMERISRFYFKRTTNKRLPSHGYSRAFVINVYKTYTRVGALSCTHVVGESFVAVEHDDCAGLVGAV